MATAALVQEGEMSVYYFKVLISNIIALELVYQFKMGSINPKVTIKITKQRIIANKPTKMTKCNYKKYYI
jgi:hypothetical protein